MDKAYFTRAIGGTELLMYQQASVCGVFLKMAAQFTFATDRWLGLCNYGYHASGSSEQSLVICFLAMPVSQDNA